MPIENIIPQDFIRFLLVLVFSLIIGLEQRRHHINENEELLFGTDRTFTFIGLLGYVLYITSPQSFIPYLAGFFVIGLLLAINYYQKIARQNNYGLTTSILALLTYCLSILVFTQPVWLVLAFVVVILILTELKTSFILLSKKTSEEEFITLAKFIAFAGVILPLLPDQPLSLNIPVSPYRLWLSVVVVSGISYISYLLKKFIFQDSGIILTGILGGLYSSTATTLIISRHEKQGLIEKDAVSAILISTAMMYLRILVLALLFNFGVASRLMIPFSLLFLICILLSRLSSSKTADHPPVQQEITGGSRVHANPLELKTAAIFGVLFVVFGVITELVLKAYGNAGLTPLSYIAGLTDIDPFLLNLLQHKVSISEIASATAIIHATNSNNLMKMIYAVTTCSNKIRRNLILNFAILIISGIVVSVLCYLL